MALKKINYVGPFQGEVVAHLASGVVTTKDRQLEVDAEDAKALLEQPDNWQPAGAKPTKEEV